MLNTDFGTVQNIYNTERWLPIFFIVLIIVSNSLLILKISRNRGYIYHRRNLILMSLATGDIFLALFPLIVYARRHFGVDHSCGIVNAEQVYLHFLIHFVYGAGLITLAMELVVRYNGPMETGPTAKNIVKSLVFSVVPWILGLTVVLPLTKSSFPLTDTCEFISTIWIKIVLIISVLLPACMAFIVCIAVKCTRLAPVEYTSTTVRSQGGQPDVVQATCNTQHPFSNIHGPQWIPTISAPYYNENGNEYPKPPTAGQYSSTHTLYVLSQQCHPEHDTAKYTMEIPADPRREKTLLLILSIAHCVCIIPFTVLLIASLDDYQLDSVILQSFFKWLSVFRSGLTPFIWICYSFINDYKSSSK